MNKVSGPVCKLIEWSNKEKQERFKHMEQIASEGGHDSEMLLALGLKSLDTYYRWKREYPEFKEHCDYCKIISKAFYEKVAIKGIMGQIPGFNASTFAIIMNNKFPDEYKRNGNGSNTEININTISLTPEQMQQQIAQKLQILQSMGQNVLPVLKPIEHIDIEK